MLIRTQGHSPFFDVAIQEVLAGQHYSLLKLLLLISSPLAAQHKSNEESSKCLLWWSLCNVFLLSLFSPGEEDKQQEFMPEWGLRILLLLKIRCVLTT